MLLGCASHAIAEPQAASSTTPIVVTGKMDELVREYVAAVVKPATSDRIARFEKAVCPAAMGLPPDFNAALTSRMRAVAQAAGLAVAPAGCAPSILLFVSKDRTQLVSQLRRERPELFGRMSDEAMDRLATSSDPAAVWHLYEERGADGRSLAGGWREGQPTIQQAVTSSRLLSANRIDLAVAAIIIGGEAAKGLTPIELADHALLRALVESSPSNTRDLGVPSILTIFRDKQAGTPAPLSLTEWDLAFLKALYRTSNALAASAQRGEIEQLMKRSLPQSTSER
jgi:hypothetical protein